MRVNGWQRIGIVLSVLWIIVSTYLAFSDECKHGSSSPPPDLSCYTNKQLADIAGIKLEPDVDPNGLGRPPAAKAALLNSLPVPIAWVTIYCMVWLLSWIRAGFAKNKQPTAD